MKICFVSPYSPRSINGIGTVLTNLIKQLKVYNHEAVLITKYDHGEIELDSVFDNMNLIEIRYTNKKYLSNIHLTLCTLKHIFKLRHKIDVLHLQQTYIISAFSVTLSRILGIPVVTTIHVKPPPSKNRIKNIVNKLSSKITISFSNIVTFVSEDTKNSFGAINGVVIKNCVDTNHFSGNVDQRIKTRKKLNLNEDFVVIFASRWTKNKGIYELLDAFSEVMLSTDSNIKLLLLGSGDSTGETDSIINQIEILGIENNTIIIGKVDPKDICNYFDASDVFVLPSYIEGLPMALLEAMSCGLTPIVSKVGGNAELVENGKNGFLISPHDVNDLTQTILWCINNKDKLQYIGNNASETVRSNFSIEKMIEEYLNEYHKL